MIILAKAKVRLEDIYKTGVTYDCNMFIVQDIGGLLFLHSSTWNPLKLKDYRAFVHLVETSANFLG